MANPNNLSVFAKNCRLRAKTKAHQVASLDGDYVQIKKPLYKKITQ